MHDHRSEYTTNKTNVKLINTFALNENHEWADTYARCPGERPNRSEFARLILPGREFGIGKGNALTRTR